MTAPSPAPDRRREFESLLFEQLPVMRSVAVRLTRNGSDADDLVEEACLRAYRFFDRFERGTNFPAWILRVLKNLFVNDWHRSQAAPEMSSLDDIDSLWDRQVADLRERVMAALDHEDAAATAKIRSAAWRRGVVLAVTASSLIALGALAPALLSSEPAAPVGTAVTSPAQRSGTLTCSDCEAARRRRLPGLESALPRADKAAPHGRLHLRDDSGEYWELLPQGDEGASVADHALAGRRATVFGILEPDLHAIRVARLRLD